MHRLRDKVAIVTGAGSGIGRGVARRFAAEGAAVVVAEINPETGNRAAAAIQADFDVDALSVRTDVAERDSILAMVDQAVHRFARVDILVNNAWGGVRFCGLEDKTDEEMVHATHLGILGMFWAMGAVFPHMRRQGGGRIITVSSLNGVNAHPYSADYNAAKEGARALTRTAAREWARYNILANIICPFAATTAYETFRALSPQNAASAARLVQRIPMGRMGDAEQDIGGVAVFLASDDARYVTGNTIFADGGSHINGAAWEPTAES